MRESRTTADRKTEKPDDGIIECRGIIQRHGTRTVLAVDALSLGAGERMAVVGPNGAGKSTLLRILAFVDAPAEGSLTLGGTAVSSTAARRAARRRVTLV